MTTVFKIRYSYQTKFGDATDYLVVSRTVMVAANCPQGAKDKVSKYFLSSRGVNPGFRIVSVALCPTIYDIIK